MEERFKKFTISMTKIRRCIQRIKAEEMAEYNLKSPHVSCLYYIYKEGSLTATQLCEICDEDKAAVSRSILQLKEEGYVSYSENSQKRYRAHIELTEKGKEIAKDLVCKIDNILNMAGEGLTEINRKIFYESLDLISSNLEKICKSYDK